VCSKVSEKTGATAASRLAKVLGHELFRHENIPQLRSTTFVADLFSFVQWEDSILVEVRVHVMFEPGWAESPTHPSKLVSELRSVFNVLQEPFHAFAIQARVMQVVVIELLSYEPTDQMSGTEFEEEAEN